jgi:hypothetical protein
MQFHGPGDDQHERGRNEAQEQDPTPEMRAPLQTEPEAGEERRRPGEEHNH